LRAARQILHRVDGRSLNTAESLQEKMALNMKWIPGFVASACLLVGCGGGGGDGGATTPPPPPESTNAAGIWEGTATSSGVTVNFAGVVTEDGQARFVDENSTQYIVSDISGTDGDITLDFTAVAQFGFTFLDGSTVTTGSLTGTIVEGTSFEGEYSVATGESGTVSMTYNAIYERDSSFEKLAGMWDEEFGVLTFDADGSFFEQDSFGCVFDGQAEIIDAQYNAYALSMTVSLCGEDFDGEYAGLAILVDFEATDDMLIIQMNSDELILTTSLLRL
jgi:hypothetical protein